MKSLPELPNIQRGCTISLDGRYRIHTDKFVIEERDPATGEYKLLGVTGDSATVYGLLLSGLSQAAKVSEGGPSSY